MRRVCTQDDSVLELFHSDLVKLYKLREHLVKQGLSDYSPTGKNSKRNESNNLLHHGY